MQQFMPGFFVHVVIADGGKCARCWQWEEHEIFDKEN